MSAPGRLDLTIYEGADFDLSIAWKDSNGDPVDLSDIVAAVVEFKTAYSDDDALLILSLANDGVVLDEGGIVTLHASGDPDADVTTAGIHVNGVWDFRIAYGDGRIRRLLMGQFIASRRVA